MKCLIVDDDEISLEINKAILSPNFDCHTAFNGHEAVDKFRTAIEYHEPYDLICMDVEMPLCNGHESLQKIRSLENSLNIPAGQQVKVIMLSSHKDPKSILDSYLCGGTSYLVKPISRNRLMQVLRNFKMLPE